jgi:hypothetical protein
MTDENKRLEDMTPEELSKLKIEFAPGCFDSFEGTQEELDEMIATIQAMFASGEALEKARPMTDEDWDELPDDVKEQFLRSHLEEEEGEDLPAEFKRKLQ